MKTAIKVIAVVVFAICGIGRSYTQGVRVTAISWSPDGNQVAVVDDAGVISIWDMVTKTVTNRLVNPAAGVRSIDWRPDGARLASASAKDGVIRIWNASTGQILKELIGEPSEVGLVMVKWSPDGRWLSAVSTAIDGSYPFRIWRVNADDFELTSMSVGVSAYDMVWSPNAQKLAIADYNGIRIFSGFDSGKLEEKWLAPFQFSLSWSPDSSKLASFDASGLIQIIDVNTAEVIKTIQGQVRNEVSGIASIAWYIDGSHVITDDYDGSVRVWDITTGELVNDLLLSRQGGRFLMATSPSGGRYAFASGDNSQTPTNKTKDVLQVLDVGVFITIPIATFEGLKAVANDCLRTEGQAILQTANAAEIEAFIDQLEMFDDQQISQTCLEELIAIGEKLRVQ
jgi:WD40 repeat protein